MLDIWKQGITSDIPIQSFKGAIHSFQNQRKVDNVRYWASLLWQDPGKISVAKHNVNFTNWGKPSCVSSQQNSDCAVGAKEWRWAFIPLFAKIFWHALAPQCVYPLPLKRRLTILTFSNSYLKLVWAISTNSPQERQASDPVSNVYRVSHNTQKCLFINESCYHCDKNGRVEITETLLRLVVTGEGVLIGSTER